MTNFDLLRTFLIDYLPKDKQIFHADFIHNINSNKHQGIVNVINAFKNAMGREINDKIRSAGSEGFLIGALFGYYMQDDPHFFRPIIEKFILDVSKEKGENIIQFHHYRKGPQL